MSSQPAPEGMKKISFGEKLKKNQILLDLKGESRDEIIRELAKCLKDNEKIVDFDGFLEHVFKRENEASTGIGNGVAIPHARTNRVSDFIVAIGRKSPGIDFQAVDGKPVEIVILMGTPLTKVNMYLKLLSHLSHLLKLPGFVDSLKRAPDPDAVIDTFLAHEK